MFRIFLGSKQTSSTPVLTIVGRTVLDYGPD